MEKEECRFRRFTIESRQSQTSKMTSMAPSGDAGEKIKVLSEAASGATRGCWVDDGAMEEK
jgi:hypothetical protein